MGAADRPARRDPEPGRQGEALGRIAPGGPGLRGASGRVAAATASPRITRATFVQLELAGEIDLPDGRYLVREGDQPRVLIVQALVAPRAQRRTRRRGRDVDPGDPEPVPVTRVTVTGTRLSDAAEGDAWIESTLSSAERAPAAVRSATRVINRALSALRAGARDPLVQEIGASKALAVRIGHGTGEELAQGRWSAARELPRKKIGRVDTVDPQSRVAAVLAGRDEVHPAETLILRARLDLEQGREAEARYGLRAARAALEDRASDDRQLQEQLELVERKLSADA